MTRPRAADDFATIRARMEELRRERAQALKKDDARDVDDGGLSSRGLLRGGEGRKRPDQESWPIAPSARRYGSGR